MTKKVSDLLEASRIELRFGSSPELKMICGELKKLDDCKYGRSIDEPRKESEGDDFTSDK